MDESAYLPLAIGGLLLLGMATDLLGRYTFLPRVSLLVILGVFLGRDGVNIIPPFLHNRFDLIASIALTMIGFLLGGKLTRDSLSRSRKESLWISLTACIGTAVVVTIGLVVVGTPLELSILLGCIASATAPAAAVDIVMESGSKGPFSEILLLIVALDDAWGLILFSLGLAVVSAMQSVNGVGEPFIFALREIGGAVLLGVAIGLPATYLTGRIRPGQPILTEALGLVLVCSGLAAWLGVSFLIASMVMGAVIANLAAHHEYPFHAIEDVEWPFMVIFFVMAGATLDVSALFDIGLIGAAYVICRVVGKIVGAGIGGIASNANRSVRRWMGLALLPQAGVAIGMALAAANAFPAQRTTFLTIVIGTTIIFEIIGPVFTRLAIRSADADPG
jgi:Kef-type K+ transport system membrane component KefB